MFSKLLFLFITVPLLELYLLIKVGGFIGALPTILIVVATAILGAALAQWQGMKTWQSVQTDLLTGKLPADNIIEGVLILIASLVLLTPGFLTDMAGFFILIPSTRKFLLKRVKQYFENKIKSKPINYYRIED